MDHEPDDLTQTDSELDTLTCSELDNAEQNIELFIEEHIESYTESITKFSEICKSHEIADYGDGMFLKLRNCFIKATALMKFGK